MFYWLRIELGLKLGLGQSRGFEIKLFVGAT